MGRLAPPWLVALCAVLPLIAPELWSGFRLAPSDGVLSVIAPTEQALSVRTPAGEWSMLLALVWFALVYWRRNLRPWEIGLVVIGGAAALVRAGNGWLDALALIAPLARQISLAAPRTWMLVLGATLSLVVAASTLYSTRPPALPSGALDAAIGAHPNGHVFADWRWASQLQTRLPDAQVYAASGLASETPDFWLDYVRIVQDYEQWPAELQGLDVSLVVLNTDNATLADQVRASGDWQVLYDTGNALVAQRASS